MRINYELAKKLKDAGFPQPEEPTTGHYDTWIIRLHYGEAYVLPQSRVMDPYIYRFYPGVSYPREAIFIPTLSELIRACGDKFLRLDKRMTSWCARTHLGNCWGCEGSTPEQAVAHLWIELKKYEN